MDARLPLKQISEAVEVVHRDLDQERVLHGLDPRALRVAWLMPPIDTRHPVQLAGDAVIEKMPQRAFSR